MQLALFTSSSRFLRALLFFAVVSPGSAASPETLRGFWFNGAEINRYELRQARYGATHPGHAEFIFVTEPFRTDLQVKSEFGQGPTADVLKLNALRTFNTGIYSYRTMTSTFHPFSPEDGKHTFKSTTSVQDWCGQVFQQFNRRDSGWKAEVRSYFQAEGDRNLKIPDAWLEDGIWLIVRLDPDRLPTGAFKAIPGAVASRFGKITPQAYAADGSIQKKQQTTTYTLEYPELEHRLEIVFDTEFPHIIRQWSRVTPGGTTTATLQDRIMNSLYWSENRPGDRSKRKTLGLSPVPD